MFSHDQADKIRIWLDGWRFDPLLVTPAVLFLLVIVALSVDPVIVSSTFTGVVLFSPIWLPWFLAVTMWTTWIHYVRYIAFFKLDPVLLEIQLPAEVEKSPLPVEVILMSLYDTSGESTFVSRLWYGKSRQSWSLEIASNEGRISFYMRVPRAIKNAVEARIYGQYPEARVDEVEDYTRKVPHFNHDEWELWGSEYKKGEPQALPIKTYIDYELDKNTDVPETKVDPLTNLFELMGALGEGQYLWFQIIMRTRKPDEWYGINHKSPDSWKDPAKKEIVKIMADAAKRAQDVLKESEIVEGKVNSLLTDREKKRIEALEHQLSKPVFECGLRTIMVTRKGRFFGAAVPGIVGVFAPFRSADFGSISVAANRQLVSMDYPWQDWNDIRQRIMKKKLFFFYQNRAWFRVPYDQAPIFLTGEEVASIWHFPNSAVKTPALQRVQTRRAEAPINLPTS